VVANPPPVAWVGAVGGGGSPARCAGGLQHVAGRGHRPTTTRSGVRSAKDRKNQRDPARGATRSGSGTHDPRPPNFPPPAWWVRLPAGEPRRPGPPFADITPDAGRCPAGRLRLRPSARTGATVGGGLGRSPSPGWGTAPPWSPSTVATTRRRGTGRPTADHEYFSPPDLPGTAVTVAAVGGPAPRTHRVRTATSTWVLIDLASGEAARVGPPTGTAGRNRPVWTPRWQRADRRSR